MTAAQSGSLKKDISLLGVFAIADPEGKVQIRWMNDVPQDWRVLGRLLYAQMPFVQAPNAAGGFAEYDDDFDF